MFVFVVNCFFMLESKFQ